MDEEIPQYWRHYMALLEARGFHYELKYLGNNQYILVKASPQPVYIALIQLLPELLIRRIKLDNGEIIETYIRGK